MKIRIPEMPLLPMPGGREEMKKQHLLIAGGLMKMRDHLKVSRSGMDISS